MDLAKQMFEQVIAQMPVLTVGASVYFAMIALTTLVGTLTGLTKATTALFNAAGFLCAGALLLFMAIPIVQREEQLQFLFVAVGLGMLVLYAIDLHRLRQEVITQTDHERKLAATAALHRQEVEEKNAETKRKVEEKNAETKRKVEEQDAAARRELVKSAQREVAEARAEVECTRNEAEDAKAEEMKAAVERKTQETYRSWSVSVTVASCVGLYVVTGGAATAPAAMVALLSKRSVATALATAAATAGMFTLFSAPKLARAEENEAAAKKLRQKAVRAYKEAKKKWNSAMDSVASFMQPT